MEQRQQAMLQLHLSDLLLTLHAKAQLILEVWRYVNAQKEIFRAAEFASDTDFTQITQAVYVCGETNKKFPILVGAHAHTKNPRYQSYNL